MLRFWAIAISFATFVTPIQAQEAPRLAKLIEVSATQSEFTRQFFGHVVARETVDLAFQVGGQIVDIPIVEGETVEQGAPIATLDLEPFELALDQANVNNDLAQRTFARLQQLQGGTVSQVTVDDAETSLQLAELAVRDAERSLRNAQLLAPFDAVVASRFVANFSTIGAGTPVARIHDMSELRVEIDVPEVLFQQAGENPDVELLAKFPASDELFPLGVREFNAETSQVGQTFQITLGLAPPEGLVVLPGSSVTVFATLKGGQSAIAIPASAIVTTSDGSTQVMVFEPAGENEGTVSVAPVTITPAPDGSVLVTEGLTSGQEIVAAGAQFLNDGDAVTRFIGFSN